MTIELQAGPDDGGRRLDRILRKSLPDHSLSLIHRLLRQGKVLVDGKSVTPGYRIQPGNVIQVRIGSREWGVGSGDRETENGEQGTGRCGVSPLRGGAEDRRAEAGGETSPHLPYSLLPTPHSPSFIILWRGAGIIVFNKPPGLASHGKNSLDTLVKAHFAGKLPHSLSFQPGPLHRLDQPTSGAIAFSETLEGAQMFSRLLREQKVIKTYLAIVEGAVSGEQVWQDELARDTGRKKTFANTERKGQNAVTVVRGLAGNGANTRAYSLIEARILTGRTHQIRAQAAARGHPLAGDLKYGGHSFSGAWYLHAWKIELEPPPAGFPQPLIAPLPYPFLTQIRALFGEEKGMGI